MRVFHCDHCGQLVFFENVACLGCGRLLAFLPERRDVVSLDPIPGAGRARHRTRDGLEVRLCGNYVEHQTCNWAVASAGPLCRACALTRTIPDLTTPGNQRLWYRLEAAKRRLVYTLDELGLPLQSKGEDLDRGLAFDFLDGGVTGHDTGVITVALEEADEVVRAARRAELGEPYRTLLGHFRHESGHWTWSQLIDGTARVHPFRARFGDERVDYEGALDRHYREGAPADWQAGYVSAYASTHPWEDWAETWAHYLHMVDTLETARASGISVTPHRQDEPSLTNVPYPSVGAPFQHMMESWATITYVLNNLNRGLGADDAYPFVLSRAAVDKLEFVHETIAASSASPR
jgi:hypothetical protein